MSTVSTLSGFGAALALVFGGAWALGSAVGPQASVPHGDTHSTHSRTDAFPAVDLLPAGLAISQDGVAIDLAAATLPAGEREIEFVIRDAAGRPVTAFDLEHEKRLHLIVVRRDQVGFQHLHPVMDEGGTWRATADLTSGSWRVFADFMATGGSPVTLATDLTVPGQISAPARRAPVRSAEVDGYTVTVSGDLQAGDHSALRLTVTKDGRPVTDLQPYLGAYGHLVALRDGDLAYLHVHPDGAPGDGRTAAGPQVAFTAEVPTAGRYYLYLDFKHAGVVRTAPFVLDAEPATSQPSPSPAEAGGHGH